MAAIKMKKTTTDIQELSPVVHPENSIFRFPQPVKTSLVDLYVSVMPN